jgi:uncharacterized protein (DUF58 family)
MHLAQRAYVLIVLTAAVAIAGIWSHDHTLSRWWHLPAALLLVGVAFEAFRVRRSAIVFGVESPPKGYLGRPFLATFTVHTDTGRPAVIELAPALPAGFAPLEHTRKLVTCANREGRDNLTLLPVKLGRQSWPSMRARLLGPLGIAWWPLNLHPSGDVTIAPDTLRILRVRPRGNPAGTRPRRTVGAGSELHQLRDYVRASTGKRLRALATSSRGNSAKISISTSW